MNAMPAPTACTCFRLRKLSRLLSQRYDAALAPAGLNVNQFSILRRAERPRYTIGSLAAELGMERTTLSRDLRHLVDAGWLRLVAGDDARRRHVVLTAAGRRTIERALPLWRGVQDEVERDLGATTVAKLHVDLDRAMQRLEAPR
ncbi:winged helix-turn-helix transcriptional regulator [Luteimonas marina]|uniref:Winged helix-turn-helix transcriptional regulator n=2 Tax=Luteimonas marina TaxID=488485 RepID=A0A5C5TX90_9GAMM|nr:winged helix-turn-helix transcriptional regulator [Luteimonas marina]